MAPKRGGVVGDTLEKKNEVLIRFIRKMKFVEGRNNDNVSRDKKSYINK